MRKSRSTRTIRNEFGIFRPDLDAAISVLDSVRWRSLPKCAKFSLVEDARSSPRGDFRGLQRERKLQTLQLRRCGSTCDSNHLSSSPSISVNKKNFSCSGKSFIEIVFVFFDSHTQLRLNFWLQIADFWSSLAGRRLVSLTVYRRMSICH